MQTPTTDGRRTTDAKCGPQAWLTGILHDGGIRGVRSPLRRAPLLATPIATPLECGRPQRPGLLFLGLLLWLHVTKMVKNVQSSMCFSVFSDYSARSPHRTAKPSRGCLPLAHPRALPAVVLSDRRSPSAMCEFPCGWWGCAPRMAPRPPPPPPPTPLPPSRKKHKRPPKTRNHTTRTTALFCRACARKFIRRAWTINSFPSSTHLKEHHQHGGLPPCGVGGFTTKFIHSVRQRAATTPPRGVLRGRRKDS